MSLGTLIVDPDADRQLTIDWSRYLTSISESTGNYTWIVSSGITAGTVGGNGTAIATLRFTVTAAANSSESITCRITTAPTGFVDDRTVEVSVRER